MSKQYIFRAENFVEQLTPDAFLDENDPIHEIAKIANLNAPRVVNQTALFQDTATKSHRAP